MNQENKSEALQPIYPQHITSYELEDDISLVDLWIGLLKFKRVYFASFLFSLVMGILAVTFMFVPLYTMTSVLEIARFNGNPIETPTAVINRINTLILPPTTRIAIDKNIGQDFFTEVSNTKGTNLIELKSKVSKKNVEVFSDFHLEISTEVIDRHKRLLFELNNDLRKAIALEEALRPESLSREAYIKRYKPGVLRNIDELEIRIKDLTDSKAFDQSDAEEVAFGKLVAISQKTESLVGQKISLVRELTTGFDLYRAQVKASERKIMELKNDIQNGLTKVVSQSELSIKPASLSKDSAYIIVIVLSIFLAFAFTLVMMFRTKVIERMSEEV